MRALPCGLPHAAQQAARHLHAIPDARRDTVVDGQRRKFQPPRKN
jgi:hypothetical protein